MTACPKCSGSMSRAKMLLMQSVSVGTQITATLQGLKLVGPRLQPRWVFYFVGPVLALMGAGLAHVCGWQKEGLQISAVLFWIPAAMVLGWVFSPWRRKAEARATAHAEWLERTWICTSCGHEAPAE